MRTGPPGPPDPPVTGTSSKETPGYFDARALGQRATVTSQRQQLLDARSRAVVRQQHALGPTGLVDLDALTKTVRDYGKLDGYLSGPSAGAASKVALAYVRHHLQDLGLVASDLATLRLRGDYVDTFGVHNLSWSQVVDGAGGVRTRRALTRCR